MNSPPLPDPGAASTISSARSGFSYPVWVVVAAAMALSTARLSFSGCPGSVALTPQTPRRSALSRRSRNCAGRAREPTPTALGSEGLG